MNISLISKSSSQSDFSERKWEGTFSKKILDKIESKDNSEFVNCMRKAINELQSKSVQKVEFRKPEKGEMGL